MSRVTETERKTDGRGRCTRCSKDLGGHRYILHDQRSYCIACYETQFSNTCHKCKTLIGADSKDLTYKSFHWHEFCFVCSDCHAPLMERPFALQDSRLYCAACFDLKRAYVCEGCKGSFKPGTTMFDYNDRHWHEKCFKCADCDTVIGSKHFIPVDDHPVCQRCYEKHHAHKCVKCSKVITKGGLMYRDEPWHRECFICTNCKRSLGDEKFRSNSDRPYCVDCHLALFAKRCGACDKPIGGTGESKFVTFDGRDWHMECFKCSKCHQNQLGKNFVLTNGGKSIVCRLCKTQESSSTSTRVGDKPSETKAATS